MYDFMPNPDDLSIVNKYLNAFSKYSGDGVIDIDKRVKHKYDVLVHRLEDIVKHTNGLIPPFRQTPYCIVFIKNGVGQKNIGQFSIPIQPNTLFIIPSRVINSSLYHSLRCSGHLLLFHIDFFLKTELPQQCIANRKIFKKISQPFLHLDEEQAQTLNLLFEQMQQEYQANETEKREILALKILELLMLCDRLFANANLTGNSAIYHPVVEKFTNLLEFNFTSKRSVQDYAEMLNLHPNHLNFLLKKHNGLNAKQIINNKIITESKYLLANSSFIIKEVANYLGFDDPNNFSTFFHKCTGGSPVAYRVSSLLLNAEMMTQQFGD